MCMSSSSSSSSAELIEQLNKSNAVLTVSRVLISNTSGKVAVSDITTTELGYLDGVTSNIQTQLDAKADSATTLAGYGITDALTYAELA